jgi:hypothetical protein
MVTQATRGSMLVGSLAGGSVRNALKKDIYDRYVYEPFRTRVTAAAVAGYGNPAGTTGATNILRTDRNIFEYFILGAGQTILIPAWSVTGLDIGLDQTATEGCEFGQGITTESRGAFVVGTDSFFLRLTAAIADVSGATTFAVGFRKAAAYTADYNDYTDFAALNSARGTLNSETALNNAATVVTDTTMDWADGEEHIVELRVFKSGKVHFLFDDALLTAPPAYTFDTPDTVVPFIFFLNHADLAGAVELRTYECGLI